ncbi:hypothetical protein D3C87_324580 [compost metagenome]
MKVIIIEEDRFNDLTETLRLKEMDSRSDNTAERLGWDLPIWHEALNQARKEMHLEFVRWAQSHGASCLRKY